ncbi:ferritin family protein [candidate division FCPU426 bacterium]|nr:ferritin family protein [candidate division FCPU426 bacterium]
MNIFQGQEIVTIAIRIEENGERFYNLAANRSTDLTIKEIFLHLRDEETKHKRTFEELQKQIGEYQPPESYAGEYAEYLRSFVDKVLFPADGESAEEKHLASTLSAIRFAIQKELDSIYYYMEMKVFIPGTQHQAVEQIITEERAHFMQLIQLEKTMR